MNNLFTFIDKRYKEEIFLEKVRYKYDNVHLRKIYRTPFSTLLRYGNYGKLIVYFYIYIFFILFFPYAISEGFYRYYRTYLLFPINSSLGGVLKYDKFFFQLYYRTYRIISG